MRNYFSLCFICNICNALFKCWPIIIFNCINIFLDTILMLCHSTSIQSDAKKRIHICYCTQQQMCIRFFASGVRSKILDHPKYFGRAKMVLVRSKISLTVSVKDCVSQSYTDRFKTKRRFITKNANVAKLDSFIYYNP